MPKTLVENLKPGTKLSKPVLNEGGMVLMGAGSELTPAGIQRLVNMNVESVYVEGSSAPSKPKEVMLAELDARFRKTENEPYMAGFKRLVQEHIEELYKQ